MSINLKIQGTTYEFPTNGADPQWGEQISAWAKAVTDTLAVLFGADDILQRNVILLNNQVSPVFIRGFYFNPVTVRAANIQYSILRKTDSTTLVESGDILLNYNPAAAANQKWQLVQRTNQSADTILTIADDGQVFYSSSNLVGTNYSGIITFSAKTLIS